MAKFCTNCGHKLGENQSFCVSCGKKVDNTSENNSQKQYSNIPSKSKVIAGLLGIFLGAFGVHNFYLGYNNKAIAQLLITVLSCCILSQISAIWGFIEGILILCGNIKTDADGNPLVD